MAFGIVGVMEIDVVAEELTAHWMVAELKQNIEKVLEMLAKSQEPQQQAPSQLH